MSIFNRSKLAEERKQEYYSKLNDIMSSYQGRNNLVRVICEYYKLPIDTNHQFLDESDLEIIELFKDLGVLPEIAYNKCVKYINDSIACRNKCIELDKEYPDVHI